MNVRDGFVLSAMLFRLIALFVSVSCLAGAAPVFIGTLAKDGKGSGIYRAEFDSASGKLGSPALVAACSTPGFLVMHPTKRVLYAVAKPSDGKGKEGVVLSFQVDDAFSLKPIGELASGGVGPCHLAVDPSGRMLAVAHYGDGNITSFRLDEEGVPTALVSKITHQGKGPSQPRQDGPHAHGVYFDGSGVMWVPDLGLDRVWSYQFDPATARMGDELPSLQTAPGAGPRHLSIAPDGRHFYVINELDNTVLPFIPLADAEARLPHAPVRTLPEGFSGKSTAAEVEVHPGGGFVYASNRGDDSIAVFRRDTASGALNLVQHAPCGGKTPRHFKIDGTGRWMICAHQGSDTLSVLAIDPENGRLGEPTSTISVPAPTCVLFVAE